MFPVRIIKGSRLWNALDKDVQFSDTLAMFKTNVKKLYHEFVDDFYV